MFFGFIERLRAVVAPMIRQYKPVETQSASAQMDDVPLVQDFEEPEIYAPPVQTIMSRVRTARSKKLDHNELKLLVRGELGHRGNGWSYAGQTDFLSYFTGTSVGSFYENHVRHGLIRFKDTAKLAAEAADTHIGMDFAHYIKCAIDLGYEIVAEFPASGRNLYLLGNEGDGSVILVEVILGKIRHARRTVWGLDDSGTPYFDDVECDNGLRFLTKLDSGKVKVKPGLWCRSFHNHGVFGQPEGFGLMTTMESLTYFSGLDFTALGELAAMTGKTREERKERGLQIVQTRHGCLPDTWRHILDIDNTRTLDDIKNMGFEVETP